LLSVQSVLLTRTAYLNLSVYLAQVEYFEQNVDISIDAQLAVRWPYSSGMLFFSSKNFISGKFDAVVSSGRFLPRGSVQFGSFPPRDVAFFPVNNFQVPKKMKCSRNHWSLGHESRPISGYANELKGTPATDQSEATADETLSNQKTSDAPKFRTMLSLDAQYPM
jgi:hypothetical protein